MRRFCLGSDMANKTLAGLKPNPKNPRKITDAKARMLRDSLARFGDISGLVFNRTSGQLVGGHQRVEAFKGLGASDVTITKAYKVASHAGTVAEGHVDISGERYAYREVDWDEATEKAANLAANKGAGEWDLAQVAAWVDELTKIDFDLDLTMFDADERDGLRPDVQQIEAEEIQEVDSFDPPDDPKTKPGDTYQLGKHTLHCGDSTQHIAGADRYDIVFTDPPYGVGYVSRVDVKNNKGWGGIKNDKLEGDALVQLVRDAVPDAAYKFICCDWNCYAAFEEALGKPRSVCVWDKGHFGMGRGYRRQHEFVMFYGELKRTDLSDMWPFKRASDYQHPTQKPVPLVAKALGDVGKKGATVYDPFGGSGSTLLAAEQLGMAATLVEFEPKYCDVIVSRWELLTGKQAKLVSSGMADEVPDA